MSHRHRRLLRTDVRTHRHYKRKNPYYRGWTFITVEGKAPKLLRPGWKSGR